MIPVKNFEKIKGHDCLLVYLELITQSGLYTTTRERRKIWSGMMTPNQRLCKHSTHNHIAPSIHSNRTHHFFGAISYQCSKPLLLQRYSRRWLNEPCSLIIRNHREDKYWRKNGWKMRYCNSEFTQVKNILERSGIFLFELMHCISRLLEQSISSPFFPFQLVSIDVRSLIGVSKTIYLPAAHAFRPPPLPLQLAGTCPFFHFSVKSWVDRNIQFLSFGNRMLSGK